MFMKSVLIRIELSNAISEAYSFRREKLKNDDSDEGKT